MANTLPSTYPTALAHPMSYRHDNFYEASTTSMTSPACKYCGYAVCQCGYDCNTYASESTHAGAYIVPASPISPPSLCLPLQQVEDRNTEASPQGVGAFPHYTGPAHYGRVVNSAFVGSFVEGQYAYGYNNEQEARMAERLEAFNHPVIQAIDQLPTTNVEVVEPQHDFLQDGTIDPGKLSLPLFKEKVPCPECGRLLKDEKSVSRHISRQHNPVPAQLYSCQESGCTYSTPKRADLDRHHRARHSEDKPYKCQICETGFNRNDNLSRHITTCTRNRRNTFGDLENQ